jgi:uncharacterized protein HemX
MTDDMRLPVVLAVAVLAALAAYAYWMQQKRQQTKSDNQRRARRDSARLANEPKVDVPMERVKAQGFGRR